MRKNICLLLLLIVCQFAASSQSYNQEKTALTQFIIRMYKVAPFTGVKVFRDYEHHYLISLVKLPAAGYSSESVMDRVAEVKARAQVSQFINGSHISYDAVISLPAEDGSASKAPKSDINELIKESSIGYVDAVEQIATFIDEKETDKKVFIFLRELEKPNKKK